jgi:hypothetical protein
MKQKLETDTPYMNNHDLPVWIVPVSGWGSENTDNAYARMDAYKTAAETFNINIEFSTRLGTFQSYKNAPSVSKEIQAHNDETFAVYEKVMGSDWQQRFIKEVHKQLPDE